MSGMMEWSSRHSALLFRPYEIDTVSPGNEKERKRKRVY